MEKDYDVIIIGGGASGMMCGVLASNDGLKCLIIDHNEKLGKKLYITGKGKCNLTNNSPVQTHLDNIVTNSKFMYSALNYFSPQNTIDFFENNGLKTRTERGRRVFPESDKSSDVIKTLVNCLNKNNVKVTLNTEIEKIYKQNEKFHIQCVSNIEYTCNSLVVATGGLSYSSTGATDLGYRIAKQFGHNVICAKSALCPIVLNDNIKSLNGLSLKNVSLSITLDNKNFTEVGEMLFTYNSLTGPIALSLSSKINSYNLKNMKIYLDLKPALSYEQLDNKLIRETKLYAKKDYRNYLATILPSSFIDFFIKKTGINNKKMADITKDERNIIITTLKKFDFSINSLDNINVGIVTSGGVDVKEINSKTCMSKLCKNLYFIGEVLDVDALTGGFNLQIAWSTAALAASNLKG